MRWGPGGQRICRVTPATAPRGHQDHPCPPTLSGQSLPSHSDLLEWRSDLPRSSSPGEAPARCVADAWLAERDL